MKTIKIYQYGKGYVETLLPEDAELLIVSDITGDEVIDVLGTEKMFGRGYELITQYDPNGENRRKDCIDRVYCINVWDEEEFDAWNNERIVPEENVFIEF